MDHGTYGFESILKMIRYRYGLGPLKRRDAYARNIARSFDWESPPRLDPPELPQAPDVVSRPCPGAGPEDFPGFGRGAAQRPKPHDMMDLVTSGYLESLGFDYRPATSSSTFREPSKVGKAWAR